MTHADPVTLQAGQLDQLIQLLARDDWRVIGPTVRDGTIAYDEIAGLKDLPMGWTDRQDGGHYRLERRDDDALFGYSVGPDSWKKYLHPDKLRLWRAERAGGQVTLIDEAELAPRYAFIGVRSCELHAIAIQDNVFMSKQHRDDDYALRRERAFIVAVNCGQAAATCFCESMDTGPQVTTGWQTRGGKWVVR